MALELRSRNTGPASAVGNRIREVRLERKLTQTELARQIGIQQSDLSRMEKGEYRVSLDVLFRLLRTLELSLGEFFGDLNRGDLTREETTLLQSFRMLSSEGQREALDFIEFRRMKERETQG
jgi:transcriptional regulator with XRE-family HTH domain